MNKYLYFIKDLKLENWIKWWLVRKGSIPADYVLGELTSGTDITINNTVAKTFYKFDIKGNSTQETTTGKNLLPVTNQDFTINGIRFKAENGKIVISGTATDNVTGFIMKDVSYFPVTLQAGTYYLTRNLTNVSVGLIQKTSDTVVATLSSTSTAKSISFTLSSSTDLYLFFYIASGTTISNYSGEIMVSTSGGEWEQYTYGASPNPSYPQPIFSAGDNNSISEKIENADGTQSQTYTIPCQQPMHSIGDVRDEFIQVNGEWKERHNIGNVVFDGTENWTINSGWNASNPNTFHVRNSVVSYTNRKYADFMCNNFKTQLGRQNILDGNLTYFESNSNSSWWVFIEADLLEEYTLEGFTNWLSNNNMTCYYQLVTPTDLPCTAEQIAILENLPKSYNEQTNIYSIDVTPAYLEVQAYVKKEEVIENEGD